MLFRQGQPGVDAVAHERRRVHPGGALGARIRARQREQAVDEIPQAIGLVQRGVAVAARRQALEPQPERGQRRPQLVRGVGDELALGAKKP